MNRLKEILHRPLGRWSYFWWGTLLMAVKYNLDRCIAYFIFQRTWYFWNYLEPHGFASVGDVPPDERDFYFSLVLTAIPFVVTGIVLTLRRLRTVGLSSWQCLLFFVPLVNLCFFVTLCALPDRAAPGEHTGSTGWMPRSAMGSAMAATLLVGGAGAGLAIFCTNVLANYGWGLFFLLPFAMGLVSVLLYAGTEYRTTSSCLLVSILPVLLCGLLMLIVAAEGLICLVMAAPLALLLAVFGGAMGVAIIGNKHAPIPPAAMLLIFAAVPFTMGMESAAPVEPPMLSVTSSTIINAPPEKVWPNVISFAPIPSERDWVLHTGVAYPIRARIDGRGVGAIRHCIFTTGEFVEPIEVWDESRLLRFSVADQPEPMEELSPYPHLKTRHLDNYLQSHEGELRLTPLPGGKTLLEGTTWYTDRIWPSAYWQLWSDMLIHHIHLRVLNHIKQLSEKGA